MFGQIAYDSIYFDYPNWRKHDDDGDANIAEPSLKNVSLHIVRVSSVALVEKPGCGKVLQLVKNSASKTFLRRPRPRWLRYTPAKYTMAGGEVWCGSTDILHVHSLYARQHYARCRDLFLTWWQQLKDYFYTISCTWIWLFICITTWECLQFHLKITMRLSNYAQWTEPLT